MQPDKQTDKGVIAPATDVVQPVQATDASAKYISAKGMVFPIFYKGSIIRIGEVEPVTIDLAALEHEPRIQFDTALKLKQILKAGV